MIIDNTLVLSEAQAITATARSTNVIDLGAMGTPYGHAAALALDIGEAAAGDIEIDVAVTEAFNNLTSLTISIETDDNAAFSSTYEVAKRTYLLAELTLGARLRFPAELPLGVKERYLSLNYTVAGAAPTTGKLNAMIVAARPSN